MKQILIIDENPAFRDYLKNKFEENDVRSIMAVGALDGIAKLRTVIPDLIILDYHLSRHGCLEVLEAKKSNPNTVTVPVIIMAQRINQKTVLALTQYNVKKVFAKPVKIDSLFAKLTELLRIPFTIDETPGIVEVHVGDGILFVEIAQGLNLDKMDMLKFKITELIDLNDIRVPKLILMLSDITLAYPDAPNLKLLLEVVTQASKAKAQNIKVLTRDDFSRKFIEGKNEYQGIEVVSNLQYAMDGFLTDLDSSMQYAEKKAEIIGDKLLSGGGGVEGETMHLRFDAESKPKNSGAASEPDLLKGARIAAVDDESVVLEVIKNAFSRRGGIVKTYMSGGGFLDACGAENFDIIFLDLTMPDMDGFAVLDGLAAKNIKTPVIVFSAANERDIILRALKQGAKSYVTKPVAPDVLVKKAVEILKS